MITEEAKNAVFAKMEEIEQEQRAEGKLDIYMPDEVADALKKQYNLSREEYMSIFEEYCRMYNINCIWAENYEDFQEKVKRLYE